MNCGIARSQIANSPAAPGPIALRLSLSAGLSANLLLLFFPDEKVLLVYPSLYRDVEKAHHRFVGALLARAHLCIRLRIVRILLRIAVPRDGSQFRSRA